MSEELHVVTGAFSFTGRHVARRLLAAGRRVVSLNVHTRADPFDGRVPVVKLDFAAPDRLANAMAGAAVLYNTYWVRYAAAGATYEQATANSRALFRAARQAGVRRIVHISITNPSADSPYGYFRGKALVERALAEMGLSRAVLRPAVLFGDEGILINNIAWLLRKLPVFGVFGDGQYRLQPIHVEDLAELMIAQGAAAENAVIDAIGPETFTFRGMVEMIRDAIGVRTPIISVPASVGRVGASVIGRLTGDVLLTREEVDALMDGLLCVDSPPAGTQQLSEWVARHHDALGREYMSELARRK